jgi:TPP-dependent pyruvate/acetoin dehydrogenase alpha subunit
VAAISRSDVPRPDRPRSGDSEADQPLDGSVRLDLYRTMVLIRTYEERIRKEYHADKTPGFDIGAGKIPGEMHLAAGQEPVAAGVCPHLRSSDALTATHRPHHLAIAHGVDLAKMTAEIFGRQGGLGHGRGGHMHLFDPAVHFSCSGIVAEGLPPALGQAFAFRHRGTDNVVVAVTGEGGANQGAFHESLNLASLWRLPVVFVIEDNEWGISVSRHASTSVDDNSLRAAANAMPGVRIEDNDVEAVYRAARQAVERARRGEGPSLIEVHTVRLWGHFEGDPQTYRPDLETVEARDPIPRYRGTLLEAGVLDEATAERIAADAAAEVDRAVEFALSSPEPDPSTASAYVFA